MRRQRPTAILKDVAKGAAAPMSAGIPNQCSNPNHQRDLMKKVTKNTPKLPGSGVPFNRCVGTKAHPGCGRINSF